MLVTKSSEEVLELTNKRYRAWVRQHEPAVTARNKLKRMYSLVWLFAAATYCINPLSGLRGQVWRNRLDRPRVERRQAALARLRRRLGCCK